MLIMIQMHVNIKPVAITVTSYRKRALGPDGSSDPGYGEYKIDE